MNLAAMRGSRGTVALQAQAINAVAAQMIETARRKIVTTDFEALPEGDRAVAYAVAETLVSQAEALTTEASKLAASL